jgi:hypothetical protein
MLMLAFPDDWLGDLEQEAGSAARQGAERALSWFRTKKCDIALTDKDAHSLCISTSTSDGKTARVFFIRQKPSNIEIVHRNLQDFLPFQAQNVRRELFQRISSIPGYCSRAKSLEGYQPLRLADLLYDRTWNPFQQTIDEILALLKCAR